MLQHKDKAIAFSNQGVESLFNLVKKYPILFSINMFVILISAILEGVGIGLLVPVLESMNVGLESDSFFTTQAKLFFSFVGINYNFINLLLIFASLILSKYVMLMIQQRLGRMLSSICVRDLRNKVVVNLMDVSLSFFHNKKLGDIVSTAFNSTHSSGATLEYFSMMIKCLVFTLAYLIVALTLSLELSSLLIVFVAIAYIFIWPRFKKGRILGGIEKDLMDNIHSELQDKFGGIRVIKAFSLEEKITYMLKNIFSNFQRNSVRTMDNKILSYAFFEPFIFLLMIGLIIISTQIFNMPIASILALLIIFTQSIPQLKGINSNYLTLNELMPHFKKVEDLVDKKGKQYLADGSQSINQIDYGIELKQMSFSYKDSNRTTLKDINLFIPAGKTIALVGPSGGGKSTFIELIVRNYDVSEGELLVDGVNIKNLNKNDWKQLIALVEQDCYLFQESIYENILYGKINASHEEVVQAAQKAHAHEFIINTKDGYDTKLGGRGSNISGGQRQRIALARALIRSPDLLILDEATSALDSESERLVKLAINELRSEITLIVIAHRLSTIKDSDLIVFVDDGKVLEVGTHDDLVSNESFYKRHLELQYSEL